MSHRRMVTLLLVLSPLSTCGCIGATPAGPSDSYVSHESDGSPNNSREHDGMPTSCEPPEIATGDLYAVGTSPCEVPEISYGQGAPRQPSMPLH